MTHEEVLLPSSLTKPYTEVQIRNDLTLYGEFKHLEGNRTPSSTSQLSQSFEPSYIGLSTHLKNNKQEKKPKPNQTTPTFFLPRVALKHPIMATINLLNAEAQTISSLQDSTACFVAEVKHFFQHFVRTDASTLGNCLEYFFLASYSGYSLFFRYKQTEQVSLSLAMVSNPKSPFLHRFQSSLPR